MKILLVEDDLSLAGGLSLAIEKQGFELEVARTAKEAERSWADGKFDLVLLDVSLPDGSGFDICREIRRTSKVPIIFLTASDEEINIITGLEIGGDDYITKTFKLAVLISRINAVLKIDLLKGRVYKNGAPLDLTAGEYKLLRLFMENPNTILSPERILSRLWDCDERFVDNNTLTVYIRRLRAKIDDEPSEPKLIITVRRMGYKWNDIE